MKVFKDDFKTVLRNIAISIGVNYEGITEESEVIVNELLLQGMMYLDDTERELLVLKYGRKLEHNVIAEIIGISKEEVQEQGLACKEKLERILKGEL